MLQIRVNPAPKDYKPLAGMPDWLSRVLWARGVDTPEAAERFLNPNLDDLIPPEKLRDMDTIAALLTAARDAGKRAVIYGDYDVDGVCASALLKEAFDRFGLTAHVYLPDRHKEGYGLNEQAVREIAGNHELLITVDCGITALAEVDLARELGMTVIVTDHHRHLGQLPRADAVTTPLLGDYPFPYLCGAGVAWKIAWKLLGSGALDLMELAALATVADMVSLTGENRALVTEGLKRLSATKRSGLRAVMNRAGIFGPITGEQVAFQLAPRMNACGRMDSARIALDMLLTQDLSQAEELAMRMEKMNLERRDREAAVLEEAREQVQCMDLLTRRAIVVTGDGWNSGVVGLAAGKLAEEYAYPTVALAREGDLCVGSARSAGDIDIHRALSECGDLFLRFGGHKQAAGLTLRAEDVEEFTERLSDAVADQTGGKPPMPEMTCDGEMTLSDVTEDTVRWLEKLEPFGVGNPSPRFLCKDVQPLSLTAVGNQGKHLKCVFRQGDDMRGGIFFNAGELRETLDGVCSLVMTPVLNAFRGKVTAECRLSALRVQPESLEKNETLEALSWLEEAEGPGETPPISEAELRDAMDGWQGTVLVCRCLETALDMRRRFPQADFCLNRAQDPRAYHAAVLYGAAARLGNRYRRIILCDGDWGEAEAYRAACPEARIDVLERTDAAWDLLASLYLPIEVLRRCYKAFRDGKPRDIQDYAGLCGVTAAQAAFALRVFAQTGLIENLRFSPLQGDVPPNLRRDPRLCPLYRAAERAKEGKPWPTLPTGI